MRKYLDKNKKLNQYKEYNIKVVHKDILISLHQEDRKKMIMI